MAKINPTLIPGSWRQGYALDVHILSSRFAGHDEFGHPRFENTRSELGELLYRLKYGSDATVVNEIVEAATDFIEQWSPPVNCILPVPPTKVRNVQPVLLVAQGIAERLNLPLLAEALSKTKDTPQLKDISDYDQRIALLKDAYKVDKIKTQDKNILLFDDLFRSGATMNAITNALYDEGAATDVFALTLTRTRSHA